MGRTQIRADISQENKDLLQREADKRRQPYGAVVNEALQQYFNPDSAKAREAILLKRLDQIDRKVEHLDIKTDGVSVALITFVKTYLSRLPEIPDEQKQAVMTRANVLFDSFLEQVSKTISGGQSLFNLIPGRDFMSEEDVKVILNKIETEGKRKASESKP